MKRMIALIMAALMLAAVLAACGESTKDVDLNTVMTDINSQFGFTGLKTIEDTDALNRYYMIEQDDVKQFAAELSTAASQYTEVVMAEGNDQAAADRIKAQLDSHLSSQLSTAKSYDADQVSMIEACEVKQNGNFVYLVVSDQAADIVNVIEAALK